MMKRMVVLGAVALTLSATAAHGQQTRGGGPVELGIDAGVSFGLDDPNVTVVTLPVQDFRLGYFISDNLELEPRFSLNSLRGDGNTLTSYGVVLGVLFIPSGDRIGKGLYVRPFLGVQGISVSGAGNDNSGYGGAGVGIKIPFADRRLATRVEASYAHGFSGGGSNVIALLAGLSFFTR